MNILHICYCDKSGGAAKAAFRHCEAMRNAGINAEMLVVEKKDKSNAFVYQIIQNKKVRFVRNLLGRFLHNFVIKLFCKWGAFSFPFWGYSISKNPLIKNADIIYLHWVARGMLTTNEIRKILKTGKRIVWYMHDMNPITGGCHYAMNCTKYFSKEGCKNCPYLVNKYGVDLAKIQFRKRIKYWSKYENFEVVTPSNWLAQCVCKSKIWEGHKVSVFPNVLDTQKFKPIDKLVAKNVWGLDPRKKTILFCADALNSPYKGWSLLRDALNELDVNLYEAVVIGAEQTSIVQGIKMHCKFTGFLSDEVSLIMAYNAADVFVSSSLADNYPNVILEAMACGLPCIGFNIGGIPDLIHDGETGLLVETADGKSLAYAINQYFKSEMYLDLSGKARAFVCNNCSYDRYKQNMN